MFMAGEASVNQGSAREAPAPCGGIPKVAPGIEAQLLLDGPVGIGDGGWLVYAVIYDALVHTVFDVLFF
jgi:hypothetical protein